MVFVVVCCRADKWLAHPPQMQRAPLIEALHVVAAVTTNDEQLLVQSVVCCFRLRWGDATEWLAIAELQVTTRSMS